MVIAIIFDTFPCTNQIVHIRRVCSGTGGGFTEKSKRVLLVGVVDHLQILLEHDETIVVLGVRHSIIVLACPCVGVSVCVCADVPWLRVHSDAQCVCNCDHEEGSQLPKSDLNLAKRPRTSSSDMVPYVTFWAATALTSSRSIQALVWSELETCLWFRW